MLHHLKKMYAVGDRGGFCCPAQMGNNGLSCSCYNGTFPNLGQGAPAHELAHFFIKRVLAKMAQDGKLKIPTFQSDSYWTYQTSKYVAKNDSLSDFLWNSYQQDTKRKSTKIKDAKLHHYFIYTGQQKYIIVGGGSGNARENGRDKLKKNNKNLYAILQSLWQCDNNYIPVCKVMSSFSSG